MPSHHMNKSLSRTGEQFHHFFFNRVTWQPCFSSPFSSLALPSGKGCLSTFKAGLPGCGSHGMLNASHVNTKMTEKLGFVSCIACSISASQRGFSGSFAVDAMAASNSSGGSGKSASSEQAALDRGQKGSVPGKISSVDDKEIAKFAETAEQWWDKEKGPYSILHLMNPLRCSFIRSAFCQHFGRDPSAPRPLEGLTLLDVGCGGGLLCEPLARMGATVMGVDATEQSIAIATLHAAKDPATASVEYRCTTAEQLVEEGRRFNAVLSLEVIEHVVHPLEFVASLSSLCRPGGAVVISTINRTPRSFALAVAAAEYILQWVPAGTHDWSKFVTPEELALALHRADLKMEEVAGMVYNPLTSPKWSLSDDLGVNYIAFAVKR